jgi:acetyl-CoA acetyltransferase
VIAEGLSGQCSIAGIGETAVGRHPQSSTMDLQLEALVRALADAGVPAEAVDGVFASQPIDAPHRSFAVALARAAGIVPHHAADVAVGGATPVAMAIQAALAIDSGFCTMCVCVYGQKQATSTPGFLAIDGYEDYEEPFGMIGAPALHAAVALRHMHEFGTTSEQYATVAVGARKHASLNPAATKRNPITMQDVLESREIVNPFHLLDCCLVSDGAGAFVITSSERASDLRQRPVSVLGFGEGHTLGALEAPSLTTLGGAVASASAYAMAGIGPADVDFAELYDCFTAIVVVTVEDYGFAPKGEGGPWIMDGRIELGGELPVNTHGGLLSQGHVGGMLHITEAVKQLRGGSVEPERQVPDAQIGVVSGHGAGLGVHTTLLLGNGRR